MTKPTKPGPGGRRPTGTPAAKAPAKKVPGAPAAPAAKTPGTRPSSARPSGGGAGRTVDAKRAQSRKVVNRRQTPWMWIVSTVVVVLLAAGLITYAVVANQKPNLLADAGKIPGISHYTGLGRTHVTGVVKYPQSPPVGGNHAQVWADCTGTVYPNQIANENAVHDLEHGAVWITYKPGLPAAQLDVLTKLVAGQQYTLLTPYAGLKTNVSLQAWGYQLFVDNANDKRVTRFIKDLRLNAKNTPELGASCDNPAFKANPSTPGNPTETFAQ